MTAWEETISLAGIYAMLTESYLNEEIGFRWFKVGSNGKILWTW